MSFSPKPRPTFQPTVIAVQIINAEHARRVLARLYPHARITVVTGANALIVVASPDDVSAIRTILQGIDVRNPIERTTEAIQLHAVDPQATVNHLSGIFPTAKIVAGPNHTVLITALPTEVAQLKVLISALDTPPTPAPQVTAAPRSTEAVSLTQARPQRVARALSNAIRGVRVAVTGSSLIITGSPDEVARAKDLAGLLDRPDAGIRYNVIYRLRTLDAQSVAELIARTYPSTTVSTEHDVNAVSVTATASEQKRISDGIQQLDSNGPPSGLPLDQPGSTQNVGGGNASFEIYNLKAAVPGVNGAASTSATDIAQIVSQTLSQTAPDLKINVATNQQQMILAGSPYSIKIAKDLIEKLDISQKLVVLDTEILEIDRNVATDLGLLISNPVISTTFSETSPVADANGTTPRLIRLQPIQRTPLSLGAQLNFLIQNGSARVLADPRITTISGRTATIRAGDTIAIETTAGGGAGTVATTQLQTFQTGVTLDITPIVNAGNFVTVALHPVVNSETGISNGIPQISTRDTQTTVALQADQTLIIGGLIQQTSSKTVNKLPFLGDIPILGGLFTNTQVQSTDNELVITVTPHIISPGESAPFPKAPLPNVPHPTNLPTLPPGTYLPTPQPDAKIDGGIPQPPQGGPPPGAATPTSIPSATPLPESSAFSQENVYHYGKVPTNNFAGPTDPVQIFYAEFEPTVVRNGTPVKLAVATTTNVSKLTLVYGGFGTELSQTAPGRWVSTFNLNASQLPASPANVNLVLTASRQDGQSASISIPISVAQPN